MTVYTSKNIYKDIKDILLYPIIKVDLIDKDGNIFELPKANIMRITQD